MRNISVNEKHAHIISQELEKRQPDSLGSIDPRTPSSCGVQLAAITMATFLPRRAARSMKTNHHLKINTDEPALDPAQQKPFL